MTAAGNVRDGGGAADTATESAKDDAMKQVLSQIMISIYRALTAEAVRCYRRRVEKQQRTAGHIRDAVETIGQFSLELDNAPPPEMLREYWRRANALDYGIFWPFPRSRHQGMRELWGFLSQGTSC